MARVLGVLRLSRDTDESTSVARQRSYVQTWAEQNGHTLIGWAEDLDVSGSVAPEERPGLGPWLTDRQAEWDVMAAWRLDRVTRRVLHLARLLEWLRERGKSLASTSEGFDVNSPMGRVFVTIIGALAEGELEAIRERTASSARHLIASGRFRGGIPPYGYRPAHDGSGWRLEVDEVAGGTVREVVRQIVEEGRSVNALTKWLNASGVPTASQLQAIRTGKPDAGRGSQWRSGGLLKLLRSPALIGQIEVTATTGRRDADGKEVTTKRLVRGDDGLPLQRAEPLITAENFARLQAALDGRAVTKGAAREGSSLLLQVAFCECGQPLYRVKSRKRHYYRCANVGRSLACPVGNQSMGADELEALVVDTFLGFAGDVPIVRRTLVPGDNRDAALADIQRAMAELMEDRSAGLYSTDAGRNAFRAMWGKLEEQERSLAANPARGDEWREEATGETYSGRWASLETATDRNRELRRAGVRAVLYRKTVPGVTRGLFDNAAPLVAGRVAVQVPSVMAIDRAAS